MKRRQFLAAAAASSTIALAGCGDGGESTPSGGTATPEASVSTTITLTEDEEFEPPKASVEAGEAVEWVNETGETRTIRANNELENSSDWGLDVQLGDGQSGYYTFEESGVYSYHDTQDTWFLTCGAVAVGDASTDDIGDLPCE